MESLIAAWIALDGQKRRHTGCRDAEDKPALEKLPPVQRTVIMIWVSIHGHSSCPIDGRSPLLHEMNMADVAATCSLWIVRTR